MGHRVLRRACLSVLVSLSAALAGAAPASAGTYHAIYTFGPMPDGSQPFYGVINDSQGRLYGATNSGGAYGAGIVFRLTRPASGKGSWTEEILHSFTGSDGSVPQGRLLLGSDGSVYGVTGEGGTENLGTIYKLANQPGWPIQVLHSFNEEQGGSPRAGLAFGADGLLYGTTGVTYYGHSYADTAGTDFSISPLGDTVEYQVIHVFGKPGDVAGPNGLSPVPPVYFDGFLGSAQGGGTSQFTGDIYGLKVNPGGIATETPLYLFGAAPDVSYPAGPPIVGAHAIKKAFYGCGQFGGAFANGGIYELAFNGNGALAESVIYNFGSQPNDASAVIGCGLVQGSSSGVLYGTTYVGGTDQFGTFFELDPPLAQGAPWTEKVDVNFDTSSPHGGFYPMDVPLHMGSFFYGPMSTHDGKQHFGNGAIYELTP